MDFHCDKWITSNSHSVHTAIYNRSTTSRNHRWLNVNHATLACNCCEGDIFKNTVWVSQQLRFHECKIQHAKSCHIYYTVPYIHWIVQSWLNVKETTLSYNCGKSICQLFLFIAARKQIYTHCIIYGSTYIVESAVVSCNWSNISLYPDIPWL